MFKWIRNVLEDAFRFPDCFIADAAEKRWEESVPCNYEGAFWDGCDACSCKDECKELGKACLGEDDE